ncbi:MULTISPECIES: hypothetical protein [Vibrio]|uniref:hypothetical protein n=1 Tax=Vibrio TaxID=662 RepID=UPI0004241607|nr:MULTISPECIES: hypothetical protein [Vibrio]KFK56717.1 hypothetical protein JS86_01030 [Vibrio vulnificus]MCF9373117.1 hypothetical protein [Vibrio parahaemolyticus]
MNFYECELQTNDIAAIKFALECFRVQEAGCKKKTREVFNRLKNKVKTNQTTIKTIFVIDEESTVKCCGLFESMAEYPNFICMKSIYFTSDYAAEVELSTTLDLFYDSLESDGSKLMLKVDDHILNRNYQDFLNAGLNKILMTENQNYIIKDKDIIDLKGAPTIKHVVDLSHFFFSKESSIKKNFHSFIEHLVLDQEVAWLVANLKSMIDDAKIRTGNEDIVEEWQKIVAWLDAEDDTLLSKNEITECFAELHKDFTILSKKNENDEINAIFRLIEKLMKIALMVIAHSEIEMEDAA